MQDFAKALRQAQGLSEALQNKSNQKEMEKK